MGSATDIDEQKRSRLALQFLDYVSDIMGSSLDTPEMLQRVADVSVPGVADWCSIYLQRSNGDVECVAIAHTDRSLLEAGWSFVRQYPVRAEDPGMTVIATGKSLLFPTIPQDVFLAAARDERHLEMMLRFSSKSAIVAPLVGRGRILGFMSLVNGESPRRFDESDLRLTEILGKRVGTAVENAQIYERERKISNTFQQAALSRALPQVEGLTLNAVYIAAERDAEIGGDWYDAFALPDGRLVLSVGDVGGKGLAGAVLMGSIRHGIRILAQQGFAPSRILLAASQALEQEHPDNLATAFVAIIDPRSWTMHYAVAGHPAPALRRPDGSVTLVPVRPAPPLGLLTSEPDTTALHAIPPRSLLVVYTDGLIESTHDLDVGETRLKAALASEAALHSANPASLITDTVLFDGSQDDVAVLTVAFGRSTRWAFDARDAMAAHGARADLMKVLRADGDPSSEFGDAELIFGELIGNVVRHAAGAIDVALEWDNEAPLLHVIDRGPGFQRDIALPDTFSESGRGLYIIRSIATGLRYQQMPGRGTHVVATLPVTRRRASPTPTAR
ncbi:MAG: SpoIIE family protein phosphatase [Candidatus Velthaea sp.]